MGQINIHPQTLKGRIEAPPSKSIAHRAVICSALAGDDPQKAVTNLDLSDDIKATLKGMSALISGEENPVVDCNESGSTLRFLIPISLAAGCGGRFLGRGNLGKRPLTPFFPIFEQCGISWENRGEMLDFTVSGRLQPGHYQMAGNISSQFISGLFFSLPLLSGNSTLTLTTELESKGYLDLTMDTLKEFGVTINHEDYRVFHIEGGQSYRSQRYTVEGDYSQAAFFLSANLLGCQVELANMKEDSLQGDKAIVDILARIKSADKREELVIDGSQCPDIIPIAAATAALTEGLRTRFVNSSRLRIKECDRITAVSTEMNKLGARIEELEDGFLIEGVASLKGGEVWSHKDHRIAMMLAVASCKARDTVTLLDPECVSKSYPGFFEDFTSLGGMIDGK